MSNSLGSVLMYRVFMLILHVLLLGTSCGVKKNQLCAASSCGEVRNISYPFRLKGDPIGCGLSKYELVCENNRTVLYLYAGRYYVKSISYDYYYDKDSFFGNIMIVDDGLQKGNCSSFPHYSLALSNFSFYDDIYRIYRLYDIYGESFIYPVVAFLKCPQSVNSTSYVETKPCIEGSYSADTSPNISQMKGYSYAVKLPQVTDIKDSCTITMTALASSDAWGREGDGYNRVSSPYKDLHNMMAQGFNLSFYPENTLARYLVCFLGFRYRRIGREWCSHYYDTSRKLTFPEAFLSFFFIILTTKGCCQNLLTDVTCFNWILYFVNRTIATSLK